MKCPNCQFENRGKAKFCLQCGGKLERNCPQCGNILPAEASFCDECGNRLEERKEAPPIDYTKPPSYTPKHLADKILTSKSALEGERKLVTVLFADVTSFTSLSEKLDPEEVHQVMDGCFQILMAEIHRHEGTINQFTGDGVMALFGAPLSHEDHAQRACHAALAIQRAMADYGERIQREYGLPFQLRMGLNSGPVVVGKIGDDLRMDYTAIGDTTNLASRMQGLAQPGTILLSSHSYRLAQTFFDFQSLGPIAVKGKEEPQEVYQLLQASEVETRIQASVARGLTRFVGRKNSLAALMEAHEKAKSGSGQIVGIVGEAGVGKSRLILEFRNRLPSGTFTCLEGRCLQYGSSILYLPILDVLRSYFGIKEGDREIPIKRKLSEKISSLDEKLLPLLPPLQDVLSLKVEDPAYLKLEPKQRRERVFEAIRDILLRESQNRPLILAIEDLHWIDKTSQEFLDYLIGWLAHSPILLLLLYRPEYTHPWGSKSYYNRIGLEHLNLSSSAELVGALLEGEEVAPELKDLILTRAAGNPLFMEEFTHALLDNGTIQKQDHTYALTKSPSEIQVPDTIQGIIAARMDRLDENLKRTLQVASVIGRDFAFRILQRITGMREDLKSHLLNLQGLEFIYEKSLFPELEYIFKHALTQEVAYNSLLLKRRKDIHERIGQAIEQLYAERLEEFYEMLAYHYVRAENVNKAYHYLKLSGKKSMRNYAPSEAFGFYQEALELLKKQADTQDNRKKRLDILLLLTGPMRLLGYPQGSLPLLEEGEGLAKEMGDERSLATFYSRMGHYYTAREGNPLRGIEYGEKCWQEAERIHDLELLAMAGLDLCTAYFASGKFLKIENFAPKVIALLEDAGKEHELFGAGLNVYAGTLAYYGRCLGFLGSFGAARATFHKALSFALAMDDKGSLGFIEFHYGFHLVNKGDGENAAEHFQTAIRFFEEVKFVALLGLAWTGLGEAYRQMRELETARRYMEKGLQAQKDLGLHYHLSWHYWCLGMLHFDLGDLDRAKDFLGQALKLSQQHQEGFEEGVSRMWLGRTLAKMDPSRTEEPEGEIRQGMQMAEERKVSPWAALGHHFLGELYASRGDREKARQSLEKATSMYQEIGIGPVDYWLAQAQATLGKLM